MPKSLTIAGESFDVPTPEECGIIAGFVLDEAAAKQLYQVRNENIRNNNARLVKSALENGEGVTDAVRDKVEQNAVNYNFSVPSVGEPRAARDPVEREAIKIAKDKIKEKLDEKGIKLKDYLADDDNRARYDENVDRISTAESVLKLAKKRVAARQKESDSILEEVDLDID